MLRYVALVVACLIPASCATAPVIDVKPSTDLALTLLDEARVEIQSVDIPLTRGYSIDENGSVAWTKIEDLLSITQLQSLAGDRDRAQETLRRVRLVAEDLDRGDRDTAAKVLDAARELAVANDRIPSVAVAFARLGDLPTTFELLEQIDWIDGRLFVLDEIARAYVARGESAAALRMADELINNAEKVALLAATAVALFE